MRKLFAHAALIALLCMSLVMLPAFAETLIDIDGLSDLIVPVSKSGEYVMEGIAQNVTVYVEKGVTATITLSGVEMENDDESPCIVVEDGANLTLVLDGYNYLEAWEAPCIQVEAGKLTIQGNGELNAETYPEEYDDAYEPATIGSAGNDFTGSITIKGAAEVYAYNSNDAAVIGSGMYCDMKGSILIEDDVYVGVYCEYDGAGIGSGEEGDMDGSIIIRGNAEVEADCADDGPGIGAGSFGDMSGEILITGYANVISRSQDDGAGLGTGEGGDVSGSITINGNAKVDASGADDSAGIGAGEAENIWDEETGDYIYDEYGNPVYCGGSITETGRIIIGGNAQVKARGQDDGAGIGSAQSGEMAGLIVIQDNAYVYAISGKDAAAIGSDDSGEMPGRIRILNNATVIIENESEEDVYIGENEYGYHMSFYLNEDGSVKTSFVISTGATINGVKPEVVDDLYDLVDYYIAEDGSTPNIQLVGAGKDLVDTGDHSRLVLWTMMLLMGAAALVIVNRRRAQA